jgi:hypothetical protein
MTAICNNRNKTRLPGKQNLTSTEQQKTNSQPRNRGESEPAGREKKSGEVERQGERAEHPTIPRGCVFARPDVDALL